MRTLDPRLLRTARGARWALAADVALGLLSTVALLAQATLFAYAVAQAFAGRALASVATALGLLADVSEGFEEDRIAIMGLYSVFLGLGQVIGAVVGGIAATWKGIDGLLVATTGLLAIGILALLNLRAHEGDIVAGTEQGAAAPPMPRSMGDTV